MAESMNLDAVFDAGLDGGFEYDEGENEAIEEESEQEHQGAVSVVELEAILQKKDFKRFHEKLNLPENLEENDDLEIMFSLFASKGNGNISSKTLFKNLFNFMCCLAGESLSTDPMTSSQQLLNFNLKFEMWLRDVNMKEEFRTGILRLFDKKELPVGFLRMQQNFSGLQTPVGGQGSM